MDPYADTTVAGILSIVGYVYHEDWSCEQNQEIYNRKLPAQRALYYHCPLACKIAGVESTIEKNLFGDDVYRKRCEQYISTLNNRGSSIEIPENILELPGVLFENNLDIQNVIIHDDVTWIGPGAFRGCTSLKKVVFPKNSKLTICHEAFEGCINLESIELADKTIISDRAFMDCEALSEIVLLKNDIRVNELRKFGEKNKVIWGKQAFANCKSLRSVKGFQLSELEDKCFENCDSIQEVTDFVVDKIGNNCFEGCSSLHKLDGEIWDSVGNFAFKGCYALDEIILRSGWEPEFEGDHFVLNMGIMPFSQYQFKVFRAEDIVFRFQNSNDVLRFPEKIIKNMGIWKENDSSSEDYSYTNRKSKFDLAEYYGWDPSMEISKEDFLDQL